MPHVAYVNGRILDRQPSPAHPRMAEFMAVDHLPEVDPSRNVWWMRGLWLDQGQTGHCTAFSVTHEAAASPVRVHGLNDSTAHELYYEIKRKKYDPFGLEDGSTVDAAMKVGRDHGWWTSWLWGTTADGAVDADAMVRSFFAGPGIAGTWWTEGMFEPDEDGIIHPTGAKVGGHAYCVDARLARFRTRRGKVLEQPHVRIEQSWGRGWGLNGRAYMPQDEFFELLADEGEYAIPQNRGYGASV